MQASLLKYLAQKDDALVWNMLLEYKFLQSLRLVTRGITHNYNNIFTGAIGQSSLLSAQTNSGRRPILQDLINRGVATTETLFRFTRFVKDDITPHRLAVVLDNVVDALQAVTPKVQILVENHHHMLRIQGEFSSLVLMMFYVGENSIQAMPGGGKMVFSVAPVSSQDSRQWVKVFIEDEGVGVDSVVRSDIFMPFAGTKSGSHRGLGLYVARQLAREHGGDLRLDEDDTEATTRFVFKLPVYENVSRKKAMKSATDKPTDATPSTAKKQVFFIIDDDPLLLDVLVNGLQRRGHIIFAASTCAEAVEEYELVSNIVTIFLVDIGLTDCSGFACVERLMEIDSSAGVIFMSGESAESYPDLPDTAAFIAKPFTVKQVEDLANNVTAQA